MSWNKGQDKEEADGLSTGTLLAAETLRSASSQALLAAAPPKGEERIGVFWRVFGGTLLSIVALVIVTAWQQFSSTLNELRAGLSRVSESQADLVKKDEFNTRLTSLWNTSKELQVANAVNAGTKDRVAALEQQLHACNDERKELAKQLLDVRERLAALEGRHAALTPRHEK